ncbi:uncharacterized protein B0I36DRAFT_48978 [Microdochium trichocladiopsis]|uniref:Uncharacterized protein n=1 Tax=Microdochium trichocladiopsis TaxID=1682393 RepID=A0A9P9BJ46_9PEZI|nr:uncharacterized protein B0I36DRAFT_48978 [Microdochium trichocladiopsis]KAH7014266.1 hypothetical protein B0I36DRAFT_48978 [Microdochium trichocladiopsis]
MAEPIPQPVAAGNTQPTLPPNISIYTGPGKASLLSASLFTRLATTASEPGKLSAALAGKSTASEAAGSFWHQHQNAVLIFDGRRKHTAPGQEEQGEGPADDDDDSDEKVQDRHHEHFREICLLLKDADIGVQYGRCVFDADSSLAAGFQLDRLGSGDVMVVDLQQMEDDAEDSDAGDKGQEQDSDDDSDDDSDVDLAALGDVVSGSLS